MNAAEKNKFVKEAKVITALEQPDFAEKAFEEWEKVNRERLKRNKKIEDRDEKSIFVNAWARVAYLAEGKLAVMGRELNKLQHRIARQRKANRDQLMKLRTADKRVAELEDTLRMVNAFAPEYVSQGDLFYITDTAIKEVRRVLWGGRES